MKLDGKTLFYFIPIANSEYDRIPMEIEAFTDLSTLVRGMEDVASYSGELLVLINKRFKYHLSTVRNYSKSLPTIVIRVNTSNLSSMHNKYQSKLLDRVLDKRLMSS